MFPFVERTPAQVSTRARRQGSRRSLEIGGRREPTRKNHAKIAHAVVSTSHRTCQTLAGHDVAEIPTPRPQTGRVRAERVKPWRQPVHTRLVRSSAKKPRGKAVGGGRDLRITCAYIFIPPGDIKMYRYPLSQFAL